MLGAERKEENEALSYFFFCITDRWTSRQGQTKARTRQKQDRRQWGLSAAVNTVNAPTAKCGLKPGTFPVSPSIQACLSPHTAPPAPPMAPLPASLLLPSPLPAGVSHANLFSCLLQGRTQKGAGFGWLWPGSGEGGRSRRLRSPSKLENLPFTLISRVSDQYPPSPWAAGIRTGFLLSSFPDHSHTTSNEIKSRLPEPLSGPTSAHRLLVTWSYVTGEFRVPNFPSYY